MLTAISLLVAVHAPPAAALEPGRSALDLPVLSVGDDGVGRSQRVEFTLTRDAGSAAPLTVAIGEDTPGGAGESLRASVWMAATVAALERRDDLAGTRVVLQLPGQVDGPSAGGAVCLAILSALDGRAWPADAAMTGAVMPDGTVGGVGAVAAKLRAAARAGAKRVIVPSSVRFEKDARTGADVDLKRLAAELGVRLVPADDVAQAYAALHRLDPPAAEPVPRDVLDLPDATEELLKATYAERSAAGAKLWDAIAEPDRAAILADPPSRRVLVDQRARAEAAYRSGKLLYASSNASIWAAALAARAKNEQFFAKLPRDDFAKAVAGADRALSALQKDVPGGAALLRASGGRVPASAAQLCAEYCDVHQMEGLDWLMRRAFDAASAEAALPENQRPPERHAELRRAAIGIKAAQLWVAHLAAIASSGTVDEAARLAATLPARPAGSGGGGDPARVERLFYSAFAAAHNCFAKDVVAAGAGELGVGYEQALTAMAERDVTLAMYLPAADAALALHRDLTPAGTPAAATRPAGGGAGDSDPRFAAAAAAHVHANALAAVSGLIARWGQLDVDLSAEGEFKYGRTDLLNHLLTAARAKALAGIAECKRRGVPCVQPIACFEDAELGRDDAAEDKVGVLSKYWNASLQAEVTLMLLAPSPARPRVKP
jgi:hypothetical protein